MSDFTPNPLYAFGRVDTSAGEGGEALVKVSPSLYGMTSEDIAIGPTAGEGSAVAAAPALTSTIDTLGDLTGGPALAEGQTAEQTLVDPASVVGTLDTTQSAAPVEEQIAAAVALGNDAVVEEAPAEEAPAEDGEAAPAEGGISYDEMTVTELRALLKERGLSTSGVKDELVAALVADDAN